MSRSPSKPRSRAKSRTTPKITRERAPYFRFYTADSLRLGFSGYDAKIEFGVLDPSGKALDQVGVSLNLKTVKTLARMLTEVLDSYEDISGTTIPVDERKIEELQKVISKSQTDA